MNITRNSRCSEKFVHKGTVGVVKKCRHRLTGRYFAVKIIKTRDEEVIENVKREFEHLKKLQHPNVVRVHELLIDSRLGAIYLVMELFESREMFVLLAEIGHYDG